MAELSDIVRVTTQVLDGGVSPSLYGRGLFLTKDDSVLSAAGSRRARIYSSLREVQEDFPSTTEPWMAAQSYFSQNGPRELSIGRWVES